MSIQASRPSDPVLAATKLHVPALRAGLVHRADPLARLITDRDKG